LAAPGKWWAIEPIAGVEPDILCMARHCQRNAAQRLRKPRWNHGLASRLARFGPSEATGQHCRGSATMNILEREGIATPPAWANSFCNAYADGSKLTRWWAMCVDGALMIGVELVERQDDPRAGDSPAQSESRPWP